MAANTQPLINRIAKVAGALHLALVPLGIFSFVYVPSTLFVRGDAEAASRNIIASESLFRAGIASHLLSQIIAVFLVWALYRILRPVNIERAKVMVIFALLCIPISFLAEVNQLAVVERSLSSASYCSLFGS